jgi:hypothetical protein
LLDTNTRRTGLNELATTQSRAGRESAKYWEVYDGFDAALDVIDVALEVLGVCPDTIEGVRQVIARDASFMPAFEKSKAKWKEAKADFLKLQDAELAE